MAQNLPSSIDVQEIQFKLYDKFPIFPENNILRSNVSLLAVASAQGLIFAGNQNAPKIKAAVLTELINAKTTEKPLHVRAFQIPGLPNAIACSADGSMLAVNYTLNGSGFLHIYSVPTFLTPNVKLLYIIRLSPENEVNALQLLWNPVITANIAVVLSNGSLGVYNLKDGGNFELQTLDKSQQVKCACWSPKGKQIVLGFPQGKLQQFKPDLTPAKTIACPPGVHAGPFDTISVHWLSTFQFAAVFLQQGQETTPCLYIVNAPKGGTASYLNYYDICYSAPGPRAQQYTFTHIQQWNLLLATSANGVEVGILGTQEAGGETPTWIQYNLLDEARIEMPLTEQKDETYPIGFCFDTAATHQLVIGDKKLPIMPMVHVLSTHGHLVSFDFLNLSAGAVDVCSPPPPLTDSSGQFRPIGEMQNKPIILPLQEQPTAVQAQGATDMSFGFMPSNEGTSTPVTAKDKPPTTFGATPAPLSTAQTLQSKGGGGGGMFSQATGGAFSAPVVKPSATAAPMGFGNVAASAPQFFAPTNTTAAFSGFGGLTTGTAPSPAAAAGLSAKPELLLQQQQQLQIQQMQQQQIQQQQQKQSTAKANELNKPLYTVSPNFTPPTATTTNAQQQKTQTDATTAAAAVAAAANKAQINLQQQMIAIHINDFSQELKQLSNESKNLLAANIGNPDEMKSCTKRLNDLQEIIEQANDRDFEMDVQNLRYSLNESYAMLAECRSKLEMFNDPDITRLKSIGSTYDPINRRQLAKLQNYLVANQAQLHQLQIQIDAQWSNYQDLVRRNTKSKIHLPCLDGIYQRLSKLKDLIIRQRTKLNVIKTKLKQKGLLYKTLTVTGEPINSPAAPNTFAKNEIIMESLADAVLSMSLAHVVDANRSKLSEGKLQAIRAFTQKQQKIAIIKPQRPDRVGLKSEIIMETKLQSERKQRENATASLAKMQQDKLPPPITSKETSTTHATSSGAPLAKPTATKPQFVTLQQQQQQQAMFTSPTQTFAAPSGAGSFNFGATSPFVKTSAASSIVATGVEKDEVAAVKPFEKPSTTATPTFNAPQTFAGFNSAGGSGSAALSFGQPKSMSTTKPDALKEALSTPPLQTPISFSAKVIGGDIAKPPAMPSHSQQQKQAATFLSSSTTAATAPTATTTKSFTQANKENKTFEDSTKTFSFASASIDTLPPLGAVPPFGALLSEAKPAPVVSSAPFSFAGMSAGATPQTAVTNFGFSSNVSSAQPAVISHTSSNTATTTQAALGSKPNIFAGLNKPSGETTITAASTVSSTTTTTTSGTGFGSLSITPVISSTAATTTTLAATSTSAAITKTIVSTASTTPSTTSTSDVPTTTADPTESFFGSLTICKPTAAVAAAQSVPDAAKSVVTTASNIFSGFGGGGAFSFTAAGGAASGIVTAAASDPSKSIFSSTSSGFSFGDAGSALPFGKPATASNSAGATIATTAAAPTPTQTTTAAPSTSIFASAVSSTTAPGTTLFDSSAAAGAGFAAPTSLYGGATTIAPVTSPTTATTSQLTAAASGNIFGGIPKPDQSVFSSAAAAPAASGLFATAAAANPSPFSSPPAALNTSSGGSLFGGGSIFGGGSAGSPFGAPAANTAATDSLFRGARATKPNENVNPFANSGAGSIFDQNAFGQTSPTSGGNLFSSAAAAGAPNVSPFASSVFGAANAANAGGGSSIFGGGSTGTSPGFGAFSQPSQATSGFGASPNAGAFAQATGASVAQSGFGSPHSQSSAFAQPVFGGAPAFASPSGFGAQQQPSFGGAATFGSPKGFGFGSSPNAVSPTTGGGFNSKFEALGSTDTGGLSFGNLAQTTNVNAPKPTFGGSSFMNYRA